MHHKFLCTADTQHCLSLLCINQYLFYVVDDDFFLYNDDDDEVCFFSYFIYNAILHSRETHGARM